MDKERADVTFVQQPVYYPVTDAAMNTVSYEQFATSYYLTVAPFMAPRGTDPAALRPADSLTVLPDDPAAAAEEIQRRWEEIGFSYFVFGADLADALASAAISTPFLN